MMMTSISSIDDDIQVICRANEPFHPVIYIQLSSQLHIQHPFNQQFHPTINSLLHPSKYPYLLIHQPVHLTIY